jgi:FdhD protein
MTAVDHTATFSPLVNGVTLSPEMVGHLVSQLFESQKLYRVSGGVHTSALTDGKRLLVVAEDIGRHNTLDKIAGHCLLQNINPRRKIILTTGRISSEMLQKSARLKAGIVISRTSPSSMSIDLAQKWGITLIGYAHRNRFNIYTHPERIVNILDPTKANEEPIFA